MHRNDMLRFDDQVVIITGAARGLGREYALLLASRGASIVVNDLGGSRDGSGHSSAADDVVRQILAFGGKAVPDYHSVEDGDKIVQTAIKSFGKIDVIINNAGILRDKSMMKITDEDWDLVHRVHLRGSFIVSRAAWPYFRQQNYGRIIMTCSPSGIYGNFGQANYSSAKLGMLSLAKTLAVEGEKYNIKCNTIVPVAASRLTEDLLPEDILDLFKPEFVAPLVVYLCHESCPTNGDVFEAAGGFFGKYRWQRSRGKVFRNPETVTPESIRDSWNELTSMSQYSSPQSMQDHTLLLMSQLRGEDLSEPDEKVNTSNQLARNTEETSEIYSYSAQDVILYALSVGVSTLEPFHLAFLHEANDQFATLPTFGTVVSLNAVFEQSIIQEAISQYSLEDNFIRTLHGEQFLKVYKSIPTSGNLISKPKILDVLDKGSGALIIIEVPTYDENEDLIFYNQLSLFMLGSGNFGGTRSSQNASIVTTIKVPNRAPDAVIFQQTTSEQAATYRLCGDRNPLHIDPNFSIIGGFERPILHGLCTLGFAVRHALSRFAEYDVTVFDAVKARFVGAIIPGQTIETRLWRASSPSVVGDLTRIHFECFVKETGNKIISSAFVDLKLPFASPVAFRSDNNSGGISASAIVFPPSPISNDTSMTTAMASSTMHNVQAQNGTSSSIQESLREDEQDEDKILIDSVPISGLKADIVFSLLRNRMHEEPDFIRRLRASYQFNITLNGKLVAIWTAENKTDKNGAVYNAPYRNGKPDCMVTFEDDDFIKLMFGKLNPQRAFMLGKLKVKGNIMLLQKLNSLWLELIKSGKAPEFPYVVDLFTQTDLTPGVRAEVMAMELIQRLIRLPYLCDEVNTKIGFEILTDSNKVMPYTLDFTKNKETGVFSRGLPEGDNLCVLSMSDKDLTRLTNHKFTLEEGIAMGKIKVRGDASIPAKISIIFKTPTSRVKL